MSNTARVYRLGQHSPLEISNIDELRDGDVVKYRTGRMIPESHQFIHRQWDIIIVAQQNTPLQIISPSAREALDIQVSAYYKDHVRINPFGEVIGVQGKTNISGAYHKGSGEVWTQLNDDLQNASALVESIDGGKK